MQARIVFSYFAAIFFALSCKKPGTEVVIDRHLLISNKWQLLQYLVEYPPGSDAIDFTATALNSCQMDDLISFKEDGIFILDDKLILCTAPYINTFSKQSGGTWIITGSDSLLLDNGFFRLQFIIKTLNSDKLELAQLSSNYFGELENHRYIFKPGN